MKIVLLVILAIIAWFVFKAMSKKSTSNSAEPTALDKPDTGSDSKLDSAASAVSDSVANTAKGAAAAGSAAVGGRPDHGETTDESNLIPSSGNMVSDISEMFKVLNLRASDAPRLSISTEQYESLRNGDAGGLSGDVLEAVMQKLKKML